MSARKEKSGVMDAFARFLAMGKELGLTGKDVIDFARDRRARDEITTRGRRARAEDTGREEERERKIQQEKEEREEWRLERERTREHELAVIKMEADAKEREPEKARQHEREMKKAELETVSRTTPVAGVEARSPKLQSFEDGKDQIDSFLHRFERFAENGKWDKKVWASRLSALLTGRALDVYSRMSNKAAGDYEKVKEAILRRYDFTEEGYRGRFRDAKPEDDESPEQFLVRLSNYLRRWVELAKVPRTYEGVMDMFAREQFMSAVPKNLAVHLRERTPVTTEDMTRMAERYLAAHEQKLGMKDECQKPGTDSGVVSSGSREVQCFKCCEKGHIAVRCTVEQGSERYDDRKCFRCSRMGA